MAKAHCAVVAYDPVTNTVLTSATVNVYNPGTVTPISATIFDKNGGTLSNPLTADATTGLVDFYLSVAQEVDLVVSKNGFTTRTYSNVPVIDDASNNLTALLTTTGDLPYASSANTPARLPIGSQGFLGLSGGVPAWTNTIAAGGLTVTAGGLAVNGGGVTFTNSNLTMGSTATGQVILNNDGNGKLRFQDQYTVANNGTHALITGIANPNGLFFVFDATDASIAVFGNSGAATALACSTGSAFSNTSGNSGTTNVFVTGGTLTLENKRGAGHNYIVWAMTN